MFVKEVQQAVLDGRADLAVHSAKDLPSTPTPGLVIGALTSRRDPRDALIGCMFNDLAEGATVATGSVTTDEPSWRHRRPDLQFVELRGNIHTRLGKVPERRGDRDGDGGPRGAGDQRRAGRGYRRRPDGRRGHGAAGRAGRGRRRVPRPATSTRSADSPSIDDEPTRLAVECERAFLAELGSGCSLPVGAYAVVAEPDGLRMRTFLAGPEGIYEGVHEGAAWTRPSGPRRPPDSPAGLSAPDRPRTSRGRLAGRRVVVTRAPEQAGRLRARLEAEGAVVIEVPTFAVVDPTGGGEALRTALGGSVGLGGGDLAERRRPGRLRRRWARRGPRADVGGGRARHGGDARSSRHPRRARAGPLRRRGLGGRLPDGRRSIASAGCSSPRPRPPARCSSRGCGRRVGRSPPSWPTARCRSPRTRRPLDAAAAADAIAFTSGSTVDALPPQLPAAPPCRRSVVAIGPVTAGVAERHGSRGRRGRRAALAGGPGRGHGGGAGVSTAGSVVEALVFDLDGTIADTESVEYDAIRRVWADHGLDYPVERWAHVVGQAWSPGWVTELAAEAGGGIDSAAALASKLHYHDQLLAALVVRARRGRADRRRFRRPGIPLAVASNSDSALGRGRARAARPAHHFVAITTIDRVGSGQAAPRAVPRRLRPARRSARPDPWPSRTRPPEWRRPSPPVCSRWPARAR